MSKLRIIGLTTIALVVGVIAGGWFVAAYLNYVAKETNRLSYQVTVQSRVARADDAVRVLRYLRGGQISNAVETIEFNLENYLIYLEPRFVDPNILKSVPWNLEVLQNVKDYRAKFPYKTNPDVARSVAEVFSVLNVQTNQ